MKLPELDYRPPAPDKMDLPNEFLDARQVAQALIVEGRSPATKYV